MHNIAFKGDLCLILLIVAKDGFLKFDVARGRSLRVRAIGKGETKDRPLESVISIAHFAGPSQCFHSFQQRVQTQTSAASTALCLLERLEK